MYRRQGQHGERGGVRVPVKSSKETVATVAEALYRNCRLYTSDAADELTRANLRGGCDIHIQRESLSLVCRLELGLSLLNI